MNELRRRGFLALLGTPFLIALLEACGDDEPPAAQVGGARSNLVRVRAAATDAPAAATAINDFGTALYRHVAAADSTGNLVMSPASIAIALTMTSAGARGATLDQMSTTLHIADPASIHRSMNALTAQLDALDNEVVQLSIANSLWGQVGFTFEAPFLDLLATEYGAGMELVDYRGNTEAARIAINQWVSLQTGKRIPELLPRDILTVDTRLTLVNAVYLHADWAAPFAVESTSDAPFTTAAGDVVQVPAMARTTTLDYATGDGWRAVELPYANSSLAMLIFVPEDGFLSMFEEIFLITDATRYLEPHQIRLQMPRFDIESKLALAEDLVALGMADAFDPDAADFSGMTTAERLYVSAVVHQANITVTEAGTEAAAATAVVMEPGSAPSEEPIELVIDRPFVFVLRDRATETVLFIGRVADPRS